MTLPTPLRRLCDLDQASPQFCEWLIDLLRGEEYQNLIPSLQDQNLEWLVEYLDNVSLSISSRSKLNINAGPFKYFQLYNPCIPGISART
jgi:hypothetical protein